MSNRRTHAFFVGVCIGLMINTLFASSLLAAAHVSQDVPSPPPQEIEEWDESDLIEANQSVCETLFPYDAWSTSTTLSVSARMIAEGRNDGITSDGNNFRLQAFVVDEYDISELTASLSQNEQDMWTNGGVRTSIFMGLIASEDTGYSHAIPVVGWASSSDVYPDAKITIFHVLGEEEGWGMERLWYYRDSQLQGAAEGLQGDWTYWYNPCGDDPWFAAGWTGGGADPCEQILAKCAAEYDSNMRFAIAAFKGVIATAGTGCIVGSILTGAFCLVGALGCGVFAWVASRCAVIMGTAIAALGAAVVTCRIAYEDCAGACLTYPGCP